MTATILEPMLRGGRRWGARGGEVRQRVPRLIAALLTALLLVGCGEEDAFNTTPDLREGSSRIWEVSAEDLPSAFDVFTGRRLFLGSGDVGATAGDFYLHGSAGSTELRLRSIASLLPAESTHDAEIQDLGEIDFDDLTEAPEDGYLEATDSTGVVVEAGHVYVLRIRRTQLSPNHAKILVENVDSSGGSVDRQFIDFRYVIQTEPGNPRFDEEE